MDITLQEWLGLGLCFAGMLVVLVAIGVSLYFQYGPPSDKTDSQ